MFVVFEGPNGVGKSAVSSAFAACAERSLHRRLCLTAEPSQSVLGRAIREGEDEMPAWALAYAVLADRIDHVARTIEPALAADELVVCDRYIPSSLVLQVADGLPRDQIWRLNAELRAPTLCVYLAAEPETLEARLSRRTRLSRFERRISGSEELGLYREAHDWLEERGWTQVWLQTDERSPDDLASAVLDALPTKA